MLKKFVLGFAALVVLLILAVSGVYVWAGMQVDAVFAQSWETHTVDFPVPFPLTDDELDALRAEKLAETDGEAPNAEAEAGEDADDPLEGMDLAAIALERAQARGKHFVESIYVCTGCHGDDFGGGTMLDEQPIGRVLGPNITKGGKTRDYEPSDWDRAVRHGVLPSGLTSVMPVGDFRSLSDRELSDIIAYANSLPSKPGTTTTREWGPMGRMLIAFGQLVPDVAKVRDHHAAHPEVPPPVGETVEYGAHISTVCTGCHRENFDGGPMPFGPPDWPPASNLTPHENGLKGWTYDDFVKAVRAGATPDGRVLRVPMTEMFPYTARMTETELKAMWAYLSQLPPTPTGA